METARQDADVIEQGLCRNWSVEYSDLAQIEIIMLGNCCGDETRVSTSIPVRKSDQFTTDSGIIDLV